MKRSHLHISPILLWVTLAALVMGAGMGCDSDPLASNNGANSGPNNTSNNTTAGNNTTPANASTPANMSTPANTSSPNSTNMMKDPILPPSQDPSCEDIDGDGFYANCPGGTDCHDGDDTVNPGQEEICDDNLDNDCKDGADTLCSCPEEGATRPCYPGPAGTVGKGACKVGQQTCQGGVWRECQDHVGPADEICNGEDDDCDGSIDENVSAPCGGCMISAMPEECGDGIDNDCDGDVDELCPCESAFGECYAGPPESRGVGACTDGARSGMGEEWGACDGSVLPVGEICGDGIDNDCDGETDEQCTVCLDTEVCDGIDNDCDGVIDNGCLPCLDVGRGGDKPWEIHEGGPPLCWDYEYTQHGDPVIYQSANIPSKDDAGWMPEDDDRISFDMRSTLCGSDGQPDLCACRKGGDFTYFQTFFNVTAAHDIQSLEVEILEVDDGARITIFNSQYPDGIVDPNSYAYFPTGSSTNLAQYIVQGENRVVITHVDDCCSERKIRDVFVRINDEEVTLCD
ncbi:MAG: MopE-related protein [Myxococcota bacterium]|nr:MopE-related protein [Myxococcota bacterium]